MMDIIKGHLIKYIPATFLSIFIRFSLALAAGSGYIITMTVHGWVYDQGNSNKGVDSWINTNIRFGEPKSELIIHSPIINRHLPIDSKSGPAFKDRWKQVGSSAECTPWEGIHDRIRPPH